MQLEQAITTRILLKERATLSGTTINGNRAIAVGLFFVMISLPALLLAMGWLAHTRWFISLPLWMIGIGGIIGVSGGLWLVLNGLRERQRIWNIKHGGQQLPMTPWLWDYSWQAGGATDNYLKSALENLMGFLLFSILVSPLNWMALFWEERSFFLQGTVGLLDLVIIMSIGGRFVTKLRQYLAFGNSQVDFHNFPFFLGNPMALTLKNAPLNISTFHLTLRCIKETAQCEETGDDAQSVIACYQIYHDTQILEKENVQFGNSLDIDWMLPEDETLSSAPSERPATYWELEITAAGQHIDYQSRFLLPIYAKRLS
ncbi:MAG: hypothetical protein NPIRA05_07430 [Nitrospirales bacterium]|nr:MAG: hypothetical protein NPIRA05_07430 [Nitrospirales bacterium]